MMQGTTATTTTTTMDVGVAAGGLRYRGNAGTTSQQQQQQRLPPPKASMSMGYMPVLVDENSFHSDKNSESNNKKPESSDAFKAHNPSSTPFTAAIVTGETMTATIPTPPPSLWSYSSEKADASRWVLIVGYVTKEHYHQILNKFATPGRIVKTRGVCQPGRTNWLAVQYETQMEAEQVVSLGAFVLTPGIWISVHRVTPHLLTHYLLDDTTATASTTSRNSSNSNDMSRGLQLFPSDNTTTMTTNTTAATGTLSEFDSSSLDPARLDFSSNDNENHDPRGLAKVKFDDSNIYLQNNNNSMIKKNSTDLEIASSSWFERLVKWTFGWDRPAN